MKDFVLERDNILSNDECESIINYFKDKTEKEVNDIHYAFFKKEDYENVSKRMVMYGLNEVSAPEQYIGVDWEFREPFEVLKRGLKGLYMAPQKIIYVPELGRYYTTKKPLLSDPFNLTHITVVLTRFVDAMEGFVLNVGELKGLAEKLAESEKKPASAQPA
jgi:hypothetical protein